MLKNCKSNDALKIESHQKVCERGAKASLAHRLCSPCVQLEVSLSTGIIYFGRSKHKPPTLLNLKKFPAYIYLAGYGVTHLGRYHTSSDLERMKERIDFSQ